MTAMISWLSVLPMRVTVKCNGHAIGSATAFPYQGRHAACLLTNRHVVTGRDQHTGELLDKKFAAIPDEIEVLFHRKGRLGEWISTSQPLFDQDHPLWLEHPLLAEKMDVVALPLKQPVGAHAYTVQRDATGSDFTVGPADPVSVIGFPFGRTSWRELPIWATGFMASEPELDFDDLPAFLIDCRTRKGQSGSPVYAHRSHGFGAFRSDGTQVGSSPATRFLGVYSGRINAESDIGVVWKEQAVHELVDSVPAHFG